MRVRSLPKAPVDFGTVEYLETTGSWNSANVTLSAPRAPNYDDFWIVGCGSSNAAYCFIFGASQDVNHVATALAFSHGTESHEIALVRGIRGVAWPASGTFSLDTGNTSYRHAAAQKFAPIGGFQGVPVRASRYGATASSITCVPPANPMLTPGGLVVSSHQMNDGGAGVTGPSAASLAAGWVPSATWGLGEVAFFRLPMDRIIDAPTIVWTSARSTTQLAHVVYLR